MKNNVHTKFLLWIIPINNTKIYCGFVGLQLDKNASISPNKALSFGVFQKILKKNKAENSKNNKKMENSKMSHIEILFWLNL